MLDGVSKAPDGHILQAHPFWQLYDAFVGSSQIRFEILKTTRDFPFLAGVCAGEKNETRER